MITTVKIAGSISLEALGLFARVNLLIGEFSLTPIRLDLVGTADRSTRAVMMKGSPVTGRNIVIGTSPRLSEGCSCIRYSLRRGGND